MKLAIINQQTNIVENVIVPPEGAQAFFVPDGYIGVMAENVQPWMVYDPNTGVFTLPVEELPTP